MKIVAAHGFLGLPADWKQFEHDLGPISAVDLWRDAGLDFDQWTDQFLRGISETEKPLLIGYSMGGRLAMHAAIRAPEKFRAAIFVSANPGLQSGRDERLTADLRWAERFRKDPWPSLMKDWNAQPVFSQGIPLERREEDFSREALASAMEKWSLAHQRDLRRELESLELPHLYLTGENDPKFTELIRGIRKPKSASHRVIDGGHRLPWDAPAGFTSAVQEFLLSGF